MLLKLRWEKGGKKVVVEWRSIAYFWSFILVFWSKFWGHKLSNKCQNFPFQTVEIFFDKLTVRQNVYQINLPKAQRKNDKFVYTYFYQRFNQLDHELYIDSVNLILISSEIEVTHKGSIWMWNFFSRNDDFFRNLKNDLVSRINLDLIILIASFMDEFKWN